MEDKIAFITGSSRGLGKAVAIKLAKEGYLVILNCRESIKEVRNLKNSLDMFGLKSDVLIGDISDKEIAKSLIRQIIAKYGKIDVLVNNAGMFKRQEEMTSQDQIRFFQIKIVAINTLCNEALKFHVKSIINIASVYGVKPNFESCLASSLQAGVISITQAYAKKFVGKVQINSVSPGWMNTSLVRNNFDNITLRKVIAEKLPIKRLIEPKEVANVVSFLIKQPLITGQNVIVDGGYSLVS